MQRNRTFRFDHPPSSSFEENRGITRLTRSDSQCLQRWIQLCAPWNAQLFYPRGPKPEELGNFREIWTIKIICQCWLCFPKCQNRTPNFESIQNILLTNELQRRLIESGTNNLYCLSVHPGGVSTELSRGASHCILLQISALTFFAQVQLNPGPDSQPSFHLQAD